MDIIVDRIFSLIGKKHGAQKQLADFLNISPNNVTDWKSGRNKSYRMHLPQIAGYYGVSLDWLSGLSDEKEYKKIPVGEITDRDKENAINILDGLTPDEIALVRAYAQGIKAKHKQQ